ncbi:unnamed protein product [Didymodactylos carnosus]|uniref:Uncharacterized protein n=1 Tax=Didymodactylos carnosus TaxID=1234261 RepID=A0A8S2IVS1_9BILA|nr:unnamed protein product [Didymodactylos carnosus]CAF3772248.1 unnamed protein product [Didymodactylos carnosus]
MFVREQKLVLESEDHQGPKCGSEMRDGKRKAFKGWYKDETCDEYFNYWHGPGGLVAIIAHHPQFEKISFIGKAYRDTKLSESDLKLKQHFLRP